MAKRRIMREFKLNEISAVDRPAQAHAKMVIMKRDGTAKPQVFVEADDDATFKAVAKFMVAEPIAKDMYGVSRFAELIQSIYYLSEQSANERTYEGDNSQVPAALKSWLRTGTTVFRAMADEEINELIATVSKRAFSAAERRRDAKSGASMADGSFPIENAKDLKNAMRLAGHAKDPAAARAHIKARAKALGLTSQLSDAYKREDSMFGKALKFVKSFGQSRDTLAKSIQSIVDDPDATNKGALIDETIKQFSDHVEGEIEKTLSGGEPVNPTEDAMSAALKKALGLADTATEADVVAAIEKKDADLALAKTSKAVDESIAKAAKAEAEAADLRKRLDAVEAEREAAKFAKRAIELGLPEVAGEILMKAQKGDPEAWKKLESTIKSLSAQADAGKLFAEFGDNRGSGISAAQEITNKAAELRKARPEMTIEKARAAVVSDAANRDLVKRYNEEERERVAKSRAA